TWATLRCVHGKPTSGIDMGSSSDLAIKKRQKSEGSHGIRSNPEPQQIAVAAGLKHWPDPRLRGEGFGCGSQGGNVSDDVTVPHGSANQPDLRAGVIHVVETSCLKRQQLPEHESK